MQVLWSRAAQASSSCRCSSCLHAATTLARRTTTAASKRRLKISDVFTACYSTILATAAFADAKVKEDRRKEWDRLIEEAKNPSKGKKKGRRDTEEEPGPGINDWDVQKPHGVPIEATEVPVAIFKPVRDLSNSIYKPHVDDALDSWGLPPRTPIPPLAHPLEGVDFWLKDSTAARILARDVDSAYEPGLDQDGQWIDEYFDPDLWNREPKKPLHLEKIEDMVASLVSKILQESNVFSMHIADKPPEIQPQMAEMAQRFVDLNIGESRWPQYKYDDIEVVESQRKELHQTLWALCFAASNGQANLNVTITKMCYNLLVSTAPPSITTYNILLDEFMKMRQFNLAQIIVDSFLNDSRLKPNKRTMRLFLDYHRARSDPKGFYNILQRMRGTEGDMRICRRHVFDLGNYHVEGWATNNKVIHRSGWMQQKAIRSRPIYNSLILGSLEFGKVRAAIRYARAAIREGHEVSAETLCAVIKAVVGKLDAYAGSSLLKALISQWNDPSMATITVDSGKLRSHIYKLLFLCGIDPALPPSSLIGPTLVRQENLSRLLWCMRLDSVVDAVERSATFLLQLDASLGMSGLDLSYAKIKINLEAGDTVDQRFAWALQVVRKQSQAEYRRAASRRKGDYESRWLRLRVLDKIVAAGSDQIVVRETAVLELELELKNRESEHLEVRIESKKRELGALHKRRLQFFKKKIRASSRLNAVLEAAVLKVELKFRRRESQSLQLMIKSKKRESKSLQHTLTATPPAAAVEAESVVKVIPERKLLSPPVPLLPLELEPLPERVAAAAA